MVTFLKNWQGPPIFFSPPCSKVEAQQANFGPPMVPLPFKCHMVGQVHWGLVVSWAGIVHHWLCRIVVLYSSCIIFWGQVNQTSREINPMFSRSANHQFPWSYGSKPAAWASLEIRVPLRVPAPILRWHNVYGVNAWLDFFGSNLGSLGSAPRRRKMTRSWWICQFSWLWMERGVHAIHLQAGLSGRWKRAGTNEDNDQRV